MRHSLVLLDADGTLLDFAAASAAAFRACCSEAGLGGGRGPASADSLLARFRAVNEAVWAELERGEISKEELKVERFRRLFAGRGLDLDPAAFSARFLDLLSRRADPLEGAEAFVRALAEAGAALAVATNGISSVQRGRFALSPLGKLIPDLLISEELGAEKPDPAFFRAALGRLGRSSGEGVVLMGDSWSADVAGALGSGLDALWFNPSRDPRPALPPPLAGASRSGALLEAASFAEALDILLG